jgi:isopenicillin N synthase-like dioxygenase
MVMRSIAIGLLLDERFFDKYVDEQCHNLRLLSYPPVSRSSLEGEGRARAGAHSGACRISHVVLLLIRLVDYGTITLLFQDSVGANTLALMGSIHPYRL